MTMREQGDLAALQHEVSGNNEPLLSLDDDCDDHTALPNDEWEDVEDDKVSPEDKPILFEELGLPTGQSEWSERLANEQKAWVDQVSALCDAYLVYRSGDSPLGPEPTHQNHMVNVLCIGIAAEDHKSFPHNANDPWVNPTLVRHGYLSPSPHRPRAAFAIALLELLAAIQRWGPSMSIQVMAKVFCDLHNLENEPPMQYSMLVTMDGNDSLKHIAKAGASDHRVYKSSYYITQAEVDTCANEVPRRRKKDQPQEETQCEKRWKSARPDNDPRKQAKLMFEETGVFISTCRHSQVLTVCDMVRSGELAKYGLATVDRLISTHGDGILNGYDTGCSFEGTVFRAPMIGPHARAAKIKFCTGAFHGPAHNRLCQLQYHYGWDDDQHANLGRLFRSKYKSALAVIERMETSISHLAPDVPLDKLKGVLELEERYLNALKAEDPEDTMAVEYIELRERLEATQAEYDKHQKLFVSYNPSSGDLRKAAATNRIEARARWTMNQIFTLRQAVTDFEEKHDILIPWTREMKEWVDADDIQRNRDVQRCIDDLERLSVQHIFEMSRAGIRGLGYKMRMHIMQAINNRSAALKSALKRYNDAASKVGLQAILWETLTSISMLADFDLLRGSRTGILEEEWAWPSNRRAAEEYQHIMCAKEEILRLNVEVRCVHTAISDERQMLPEIIEQIAATSPEPQWAVNHYVERRLKVNNNIMHELNILMRLKQYTGLCDTGVRLGRQVDNGVAQPPAQSPSPDTLQNNMALEGSMLASQLPATLVDEEGTLCDAADVSVDDEAGDVMEKVQDVFESLLL
ncbi:hypothetical protein FRC06_005751 [Ceratobasidium sp. 370]|nr:hypothetical protein FRC06_005751 [Ceratobasidium sp. 370]